MAQAQAKGKTAVKPYTRKSGVKVRAHFRNTYPRFEVVDHTYFAPGCTDPNDPLYEVVEYCGVSFGYEDCAEEVMSLNQMAADPFKQAFIEYINERFQIMENEHMTLKELIAAAHWTPEPHTEQQKQITACQCDMMYVFATTNPGTEARWKGNDEIKAKYPDAILEKAFPVEVKVVSR